MATAKVRLGLASAGRSSLVLGRSDRARSCRQQAVADELEELAGPGRTGRRSAPSRRWRPTVSTVLVGGLEGELREPGGGEVGPDGRRGVGRAAVPGPDRPGRPARQKPGSAWMVRVMSAATDVPEDPADQHQVGRHVVRVPAGTARRRPRRSGPGSATPAAAARSRAKATRAGSSSTSSAETSGPRGWVATTSITSRPWPGAQAHDPDRALDGYPGTVVERRRAPWTARAAAAARGSTTDPRRARASAPSASPTSTDRSPRSETADRFWMVPGAMTPIVGWAT